MTFNSANQLRLSELREFIGVSRPTIYKIIKKEGFPECFYLSDRIRVWDKDEVSDWLRKRKARSFNERENSK